MSNLDWQEKVRSSRIHKVEIIFNAYNLHWSGILCWFQWGVGVMSWKLCKSFRVMELEQIYIDNYSVMIVLESVVV